VSTVPSNCLSIVVPAFNEVRTLASVVNRSMQVPGLLEIIIIDDASTDGTHQVCAQLAQEFPRARFHA